MPCHVCGKSGSWIESIYTCRICGRQYCGAHGKDGVCAICREKIGKK